MADLSKITLPDGSTYDFKDSAALHSNDVETTVANDSKLPTGAAVQSYVSDVVDDYVAKTGDTMTGPLTLSTSSGTGGCTFQFNATTNALDFVFS